MMNALNPIVMGNSYAVNTPDERHSEPFPDPLEELGVKARLEFSPCPAGG